MSDLREAPPRGVFDRHLHGHRQSLFPTLNRLGEVDGLECGHAKQYGGVPAPWRGSDRTNANSPAPTPGAEEMAATAQDA